MTVNYFSKEAHENKWAIRETIFSHFSVAKWPEAALYSENRNPLRF
jgi:hypothetical protein